MIHPRSFERLIGSPRRRGAVLLSLFWGTACAADPVPPPVSAEIGRPLPGLSAAEADRFEQGRTLFRRIFTPEEGLGPRFNENSCNACHTFPADGGTGETAVTKRTRDDAGRCDLLVPHGGENVRIQVTRIAAGLGATPTREVEGATHTGRFTIPFIFGLGLVEAIPQGTLDALADPDDADGDGISGRVGRTADGRPARFGRKADVATLADFNDSAFRLEMGLTTPSVPDESRAGGTPPVPDGSDPAPEPEIDAASLARVTDFVRFLAPPAPAERDDPEVLRGRETFEELGCTSCHVPVLTTGEHESPALAHQRIALYSDLLLHDMGPDFQGSCGAGASTTEYRTEPLLGLRHRQEYLHDGRARRVMDAILAHGGEAAAVRARFAALNRLEQEYVLRFLDTL
ncbi:MAG: di-heme oxidoredictase family protein [Longimicrobiales bacterium]